MRTSTPGGKAEDPQVTLTCMNCDEEIIDSRARLKARDWECPYCGGNAIGDEDEQTLV